MSAIDELFTRLKSNNQKAFMPFITAGDPDIEFTASLIRELVARGSHMCEVGIPYSDPIADGPVIQASYSRALDNGITLDKILAGVNSVTGDLAAPVVSMVSFAIVLRIGIEEYVAKAKAAGFSGAIVPDLPLEEATKMSEVCRREDFSLIQLVTPATPPDRAVRIADTSTGFLYYVSVTGITGERTELPPELVDNVGQLREKINLPICIGFGINKPEHVCMLSPVADGLIVGSAIVKRIAAAADKGRDSIVQDVGDYVETMIAALP